MCGRLSWRGPESRCTVLGAILVPVRTRRARPATLLLSFSLACSLAVNQAEIEALYKRFRALDRGRKGYISPEEFLRCGGMISWSSARNVVAVVVVLCYGLY